MHRTSYLSRNPYHTSAPRLLHRTGLLFVSLLLCAGMVPVSSAQEPVTRRDGFLMMWNAIRRPAYPARTAFADLPEEERGSLEIDYAVDRGLLDDAETFRPDDPLTVADAQLWLLRTRNVEPRDAEGNVRFMHIADPEEVPALAHRYGIDTLDPVSTLTADQLQQLMRVFDTALAEETKEASLYAEKFHGKGTAFGESFDMNSLTAAHRSYPHNTLVRVTNIENGQSVTVRINDRGPFVQGRDIDLSLAAFTTIADRSLGRIDVRLQRLGDASLAAACGEDTRYQKRITREVRFHRGIPHRLPLGDTLTLGSTSFFVVHSVTYPDGTRARIRQWVTPDEERFTFTPSLPGLYRFALGTASGRQREMEMVVEQCGDDSVQR